MSSVTQGVTQSIETWIHQGATYFEEEGLFFGHGTDNALDEAAVLVCWALNITWDELEAKLAQPVDEAQAKKIADLFDRRCIERLPAAYLTGEAWFAGLKFKVNCNVLVPRSPLAELIRNEFSPWLYQQPRRILDLCCGSGCIGLACAWYNEDAEVVMSDISVEAIELAKENIALHGLAERVEAVQSDAFVNIEGKFDLIVSNPPYVDAEDFASMPAEYRAEPKIGLASGQDGLDFTRIILKNAAKFLNEKGTLIVEVGNSAEALEQLLPRVPFMWPEFEFGGQGVFVLSREDLINYESDFADL